MFTETIQYLKDQGLTYPQVGLILGSGLGELAEDVENAIRIPYENIPNFPVSTVAGHAGQLVYGDLAGKKVLILQGRFHYYEGYDLNTVTYPVRIFKELGVETVIVTNAAGGINTSAVVTGDEIVAMVDGLKEKGLGELLGILLETSMVKLAIQAVSIVIMLVVYGRMFEIYIYASVSAIPFATMGNKEWGQIGNNYIKGLFALGLQGLFLMVCFGIYAVLIKTIEITDIHASIFAVLGYSVLLGLMLLKSGTLAKSVMNAH